MLVKHVRPPLVKEKQAEDSRIRFHTPITDSSSGYGRLGLVQINALGGLHVGADDSPDYALCHPGCLSTAPIRFTMWEPDDIPLAQRNFSHCRALIVPSTHNAQVFRKAKFRGAIIVVPLYGDAPYFPMPDDSTLKFICIARDNGVRGRKGIDNLIKWFSEAFPSERDVFLTVKHSPWCFKRETSDTRISIIYENWPEEKHYAMMAEHHCGVFLSGLEGWNMPLNELMAMGRPSMVAQYGGPADFVSDQTSFLLPYEMVPAPTESPYLGCGYGASPTKEGVIETFRHIYRNRGELQAKAMASYAHSMLFTKQLHSERLRVAVAGLLGK
jgi:glycosyltransferase involved in cell wall biosynthesis